MSKEGKTEMAAETMTSEERVWAAVKLERTDRVPLAILASAGPFARLAGLTPAEFYADEERASRAIDKTFEDVGGWDLDFASTAPSSLQAAKTLMTLVTGMKLAFPGVDLPEDYPYQASEEEVLKTEDYDTLAEIGWREFMFQDYAFRLMDISPDELNNAMVELAPGYLRDMEKWKKRGVVCLYPVSLFVLHPFFRLSLGRSMVKFTEDLYYRPEGVERALKKLTEDFIADTIGGCRLSNSKFAYVVEERAGGFFYPPRIFERFWWPYTVQMVEAFHAEGIVTWFHLDTSWDKNISYFRQLPRGSAVLALDGTTDIFAAKEVLRDHLCLSGDVHPAMLSIGEPAEVEAYARRLIDEVGGDGGFILSSGCELPADVKLENLRAMIQTGKIYEPSRRGRARAHPDRP